MEASKLGAKSHTVEEENVLGPVERFPKSTLFCDRSGRIFAIILFASGEIGISTFAWDESRSSLMTWPMFSTSPLVIEARTVIPCDSRTGEFQILTES
jgi:hypothetical protein